MSQQATPTPTISGTGNASIQHVESRATHAPLTVLSGGCGNARALLEHWDGQHWSVVPFSDAYSATWGMSQFNALAASSPNDIWAVGSFENRAGMLSTNQAPGPFEPLVEHWNGTAWQNVSDAAFPHNATFSTIAAVSPDDIWISGSLDENNGGGSGGGNPNNGGLLLHWNGQRWQQTPMPQHTSITAFSTLASNDIWAINENFVKGSTDVVVHWNGTTWSGMSMPDAAPQQDPGASVQLSDIAAISGNNVWVVGTAFSSTPNTFYQVVEHWDGQQWHVLPANRHDDPGSLNGAASIAGNVWAVGITYTGLQQIQGTLIEKSC